MENKMSRPTVVEPKTTCPWESGQLGNSEEYAVACDKSHNEVVDEAIGLQLISIRLPKQLIDNLKMLSVNEGVGYQPLIRRVLIRWVQGEFQTIADQEQLAASRLLKAKSAEPVKEPRKRRTA
jgi:hypothetical protein